MNVATCSLFTNGSVTHSSKWLIISSLVTTGSCLMSATGSGMLRYRFAK